MVDIWLVGYVVVLLGVAALAVVVKKRSETVLVQGRDSLTGDERIRALKPDKDNVVRWPIGDEELPIDLSGATRSNPKGLRLRGVASKLIPQRPLFKVDVREQVALVHYPKEGEVRGADERSAIELLGFEGVRQIREGSKAWWEGAQGLILIGFAVLTMMMLYLIWTVRGLVGGVGGA